MEGCDHCEPWEEHLHWKTKCGFCGRPKPVTKYKHAFHVVDTVNYKYYYHNGGNVSKARVENMKKRCLAPHGNGEVVVRDMGRITDRPASY